MRQQNNQCAAIAAILRAGAAEIVETIDDLRGRGEGEDVVAIEAGQQFERLRQRLVAASTGATNR